MTSFRIAGLAGALLLVTGCASKKLILDPVTPSTITDGDATGIVEACGNQPIVGFTYCRVSEGDNADQSISFIGPPSQCHDPNSCVFIKVYNNQSQLAGGFSIPQGQTRVTVAWKDLLGGPAFQVNQRGFWSWNEEVHYLGPDGKERVSTAQGDIVLRVFKKGYIDLHTSEDDPSYAWQWLDGDFQYKMTSGLRAFISRKKKP